MGYLGDALGRLMACCRRVEQFSDEAKLDSAALAELAAAAAGGDAAKVLRLVAEHWQLYETYSQAEQRRLDDAVAASAAALAVART